MSDHSPKVSVIIPVYNVEKYLSQCLDSVLAQTLTDIEVICVDDGSTDSSLSILREYAARDSRVKVLTQENRSAGAARNNGMSVAGGEYYSFLDSDDFFEPDMLEKSYAQAKAQNADVIVFRCDRYNEDSGTTEAVNWSLRTAMLPKKRPFAGVDIPQDAFKVFVGWPWDKLFSARFVRENGLTFQEQRTTNDMLFVFSAVAKAERITVMEDVFAHQRRKASDSLSVTREKSWDCFHNALVALRDQLKAWDLYPRFERDYINYCLHACLWNLETLAWPTQEKLFDTLKGEWFRELGVADWDEEYFYNKGEYAKYREIVGSEYDELFSRVNGEGQTLDKDGNVIPPRVTVILPSLNVGEYIRECLESVTGQSLRSLEILCVDAGSTDGTLEVLREFEEKDPRVHVILSDQKSYGHQMNLGLDAATGEYIGIVETDDFASQDMFEKLYRIAAREDLDFIKADFCRFVHDENGKLVLFYNQLSENDLSVYGKVLDPRENEGLFNLIMNTWSGIYKRSFLNDNHIRHNETPGASYQDNGFWFQTFALARRVYFVHEPYYMNRRDNPNSSVHNKAKVYCMNEEYDFIRRFLEADPERRERLIYIYCYKKYNNYIMTFNRLGEEYKLEYIMDFSEEFRRHREAGELDRARFEGASWQVVTSIMDDPLSYYLTHSDYYKTHPSAAIADGKTARALRKEGNEIRASASYKIGRFITWPARKARTFLQCLRDHGLKDTIKIYLHRGNGR